VTLHILNASPFADPALTQCARVLADGDALLLVGDGTYAALEDGAFAHLMQGIVGLIEVCALAEDCQARGITARLCAGVRMVGYREWVELAVRHEKSISWFGA
jgi:tRNA 2-thiouridine synthesizing protein B